MATLIEVATRISQNLDNPDSPSPAVIQYWLRNNLGLLNNLINVSYTIDQTDGTVEPDIGDNEASIFQHMYLIHYYDGRIRANLGAAAIDPVLEVSENGAIVRLTNKNQIALTFAQLKRQEQEILNGLVTHYRMNNATPQQVAGADTIEEWYDGTNSNLRTTND